MKKLAYATLGVGLFACLVAMFVGGLVVIFGGDAGGPGAIAVSLGALGVATIGIALLWKST
jgi:hypothetical protein